MKNEPASPTAGRRTERRRWHWRPVAGTDAPRSITCASSLVPGPQAKEGGHAAVSALMQRSGARLSVALHQSNAALLRSATGSDKKAGGRELACALAG